MCVCTVLSSYCWRRFNFLSLGERAAPRSQTHPRTGIGKICSSYLQIQKWDTNRNVFKLLCFVWQTVQTSKIFNLPSLPANPHIFHEKLNAENVFVSLVFEMKTLQLWNLIQPKPVFSELCKTPVAFFLRTVIKKKCFLVLQKEHALFNPRMYHFILKLKKKIQH